jgi:hypothetical protein
MADPTTTLTNLATPAERVTGAGFTQIGVVHPAFAEATSISTCLIVAALGFTVAASVIVIQQISAMPIAAFEITTGLLRFVTVASFVFALRRFRRSSAHARHRGREKTGRDCFQCDTSRGECKSFRQRVEPVIFHHSLPMENRSAPPTVGKTSPPTPAITNGSLGHVLAQLCYGSGWKVVSVVVDDFRHDFHVLVRPPLIRTRS